MFGRSVGCLIVIYVRSRRPCASAMHCRVFAASLQRQFSPSSIINRALYAPLYRRLDTASQDFTLADSLDSLYTVRCDVAFLCDFHRRSSIFIIVEKKLKQFKTACKDDRTCITPAKPQISKRVILLVAHRQIVNVLTSNITLNAALVVHCLLYTSDAADE